MKSILLIVLLLVLVSSGVQAQYFNDDPGIADTLILVINVDEGTTPVSGTLQLWSFNDSLLDGGTIPLVWDNPNCYMVSFEVETVVTAGWTIVSYWERSNIDTTNANQQFLLGGVAVPPLTLGIASDPSGRRLFGTYHFEFSEWNGAGIDGVTFDTTTWGTNAYVLNSKDDVPEPANDTTIRFQPIWGGPAKYGNFTGVYSLSQPDLPDEFSLRQNYPNPFNPRTRIDYDVPVRSHVSLKVYNILGQEVRTLVNEDRSPGAYYEDFDGSGLATGIYFYKLESETFTETKKMILVK